MGQSAKNVLINSHLRVIIIVIFLSLYYNFTDRVPDSGLPAYFSMKKLLIIALLLIQSFAYGQPLSPQAKKVKHAYDELLKLPHAPVLQIKYIQVFPGNKVDFMDVFNAHTQDQLAGKSVDYVKKFRKLGYDYIDSVLPKSIQIGKEMPTWSEGAVDELQKTIYYLTNKNPMLFVNTVKELTKEEQALLASFLISGEGGVKNVNYDTLLDILDKAGEKKLHKIFSEATLQQEGQP